jgi:hypothetical protein
MKKSLIILIVILALGAFFALFSTKFGVKLGGFQISLNNDKQALEKYALSFLEDIKFKDFKKAATYHSEEDQKKVDIPKLIERLFQVKPEFLDIMKYEITDIDIDASGSRARVKTHTTIKILNSKEIKEPEVILYWQKDKQGQWYMKLESSLH